MVLASVVWRSVQYRVVASRVESQAHRLCSPAALSTPPRRHWLSRFLFFATFANRPSPSRQTRSHSARPCPLREAPTLARSNCASVSVCRPARAPLSLSLCRCVCVSAPLCVCVYLRARGVCGQQLSSKSCFTLLFRPTAVAGLSSLAPRPQSCVFYYCRGTKRDAKRRHPCTKTITTAGQDMESAPFETTASGSVHLHGYDSISVG